MVKYLTCLMILSSFSSFGQDPRALEYVRQEEQRKKAEIMRQLDSGIYFLDIGKHEAADQKFKYVLANVKSVPSDLTFYFGKNSFYLRNFKQSIDWLNKYLQLKGTSGQYYNEAVTWLKKAEDALLSERAATTEKAEDVLSRNYDIDCGPSGMVSCPVCKGDHVIIKRGAFGDEYRTCPYCNQHGFLTCVEYNQLLKGELTKKNP